MLIDTSNLLISRALVFATAAHGAMGQVRDNTGKPYIVHPIAVAELVAGTGAGPVVVAGALTHDVPEDVNYLTMRNAAIDVGTQNITPVSYFWIERAGLRTFDDATWANQDFHADRISRLLLLSDVLNPEVAQLVEMVTNVTSPEDGPRKLRLEIEVAHLAKAKPDAKTMKVADIVCNLTGLAKADPKRARSYFPEKEQVLRVMDGADPALLAKARSLVSDYFYLYGRKVLVSQATPGM